MKILSVTPLVLPDVKIVRFARFSDARGYFAEPFRRSDVDGHPDLGFLRGTPLPQMNESWSRAGVVRGLHFQWNPYVGKLVRTVSGRMVDLFLDIRLGSPTFGHLAACDMPASDDAPYGEWIWVPPGFAHGNFFTEPSRIEYLCTGEYSPGCEAGLSPLAPDLDWSSCDAAIKREFDGLVARGATISQKDTDGLSLTAWKADERSANFVYGRC
ncbi:MAG: dTDP-4-dehydrorhamnose 3,5-epimerase family protein [Acidobacteria bacterium]|nr:dTDP-4-dehydrorhamnose 3,5-epimerase family protein [Acidobacteriota bacterium]